MDITAYVHPKCGACKRQKLPNGADRVDVRTADTDIRATPTIDVTCKNGDQHRFVGRTDPDDIREVCQR